MDENPQILVTLSGALFKRLRKQAREKHVPLRYLVAGLVCDLAGPLESCASGEPTARRARSGKP